MNEGGLTYNVENLRMLADNLEGSVNSFEIGINAMFAQIDYTLANYWSGATYDAFKANCENFRKSRIESVINDVRTWAKDVDSMASNAAATTSKNTSLFM